MCSNFNKKIWSEFIFANFNVYMLVFFTIEVSSDHFERSNIDFFIS